MQRTWAYTHSVSKFEIYERSPPEDSDRQFLSYIKLENAYIRSKLRKTTFGIVNDIVKECDDLRTCYLAMLC